MPAVLSVQGVTRAVGAKPPVAWRGVSAPTVMRTFVSGCTAGAQVEDVAEAVAPGGSNASFTYMLACVGAGARHTLRVTDAFGVGANGSALWETTLASASEALWSADEIGHDYWLGFNSTAPPLGWFPGAGGKAFYPRAGFSPLSPWSIAWGPPSSKVDYGSEGGEVVTVLGMGAAIFPDSDASVAFVQNPDAFPYLAGLGICGKNAKGQKKEVCPTRPLPATANTSDTRADRSLFFSWMNQGYRLGGDTAPVQLRQNLLLTNADWRPSFGWAVANLPEFFEPAVNMSAVDGPGTYAHLGHAVMEEKDGGVAQVAWDTGYNFTDGLVGNAPFPAEYLQLGNTINWDATFPYQSHGNFIPYNLSSGEAFGEAGWTTCFGAYNCSKKKQADQKGRKDQTEPPLGAASHSSLGGPDPISDCKGGRAQPGGWIGSSIGGAAPCWTTSYQQINDVYRMLREKHGIHNCMYGNFWEYGFNVSDLKQPLYCDQPETLTEFERNYCDTNLPLRTNLKHSWLPNWSGKSASVDRDAMMRNGMDGSIVMDAADPAYHVSRPKLRSSCCCCSSVLVTHFLPFSRLFQQFSDLSVLCAEFAAGTPAENGGRDAGEDPRVGRDLHRWHRELGQDEPSWRRQSHPLRRQVSLPHADWDVHSDRTGHRCQAPCCWEKLLLEPEPTPRRHDDAFRRHLLGVRVRHAADCAASVADCEQGERDVERGLLPQLELQLAADLVRPAGGASHRQEQAVAVWLR